MIKDICKPSKMIVCTVPRGLGHDIIQALYEQVEIINVEHDTGRGVYDQETRQTRWQEIDILIVIVALPYADQAFNLLYRLSQLHDMEGRYIHQVHLPYTTTFVLPTHQDMIINKQDE